jgi:hypothetical protein
VGAWLGFSQIQKIRFRFFRGCSKFLSLKIVLCQFFFPLVNMVGYSLI